MKTIRLNQEQLSDLFIKGECIIGDIKIFGSLPYKSDLGPIHKSMEVLRLYEYLNLSKPPIPLAVLTTT